MIRIFFSVLLLFSILFLPFYLSVILAILGMILFSFFWEAVLLLFISDLLYGTVEMRLLNIFFFSFIFSLVFLFVTEFVKKKLKFYQKK